MQQVKNKIDFITAVRAIATMCVLFQHTSEAAGYIGFQKSEFGGSWLNFGEIGVLAFFLVSGFVIPLSLAKKGNMKDFWMHRALRIYPLYFVICIITVFSHALISGLPPDTIKSLFFHIFFAQEWMGLTNFVSGSWTLFLELIWYVACSILFLSFFSKRSTELTVFLCLAVLMVTAVAIIHNARIPMGRISFSLIFLWGLLSYRFTVTEITKKHYAILSSLIITTIIWALFVGFYLYPSAAKTSPSFRCVMLSWCVGSLLFLIPMQTKTAKVWGNGIFRYLGRVSYSIYLTHPLIIYLIKSTTALSGFSLFVSTILITLVVSKYTYQYIEAPANAFAHKRKIAAQLHLEARAAS